MKKIVILGGGISGLTLLWYLNKKYGSSVSIDLLEKNSRVGGWIQTASKGGTLFERGPRSCRTQGHGQYTLQLIEELGLEEQVITADRSAQQRYLYVDQQLQRIPTRFWSFLFSPLTRKVIPHLFKEWKIPSGIDQDESIHSFFCRRLGGEITETFVDPLISGIYAGDIRQLSVKSCFPILFQWEQEYGSLLKGRWMTRRTLSHEVTPTPFIQKIKKEKIFSFKKGMETLTNALAHKMNKNISLKHEVLAVHFHSEGIILNLSNGKTLNADLVYSTLPAQALSSLMRPHDAYLADLLKIPTASVAVVNLGYKQNLLKQKGFGYLIPSKEKEEVLGIVWDSCVFPQQNQTCETRLTVMLGGTHAQDFLNISEGDFLQAALGAVSRHLGIMNEPDHVDIFIAREAIPQYVIGHEEKKEKLFQEIKKLSPNFHLLGSSFEGVSINDCIQRAYHLAHSCSF